MLVRITFSARLISEAMPSAFTHGIGSVLLMRFCLARIRSALRRRSPAVTRYAARLSALAVSLWFDHERLQEPVCRNARGELLEPDIRAGFADIGRRGLQLVERDVLRGARDSRFRVHVDLLCTAPTPTHSTLADAGELDVRLMKRARGAP